jgi:hypothetical protein
MKAILNAAANMTVDHPVPLESDPEEFVRFVKIAAKYLDITSKSQQSPAVI